MANDRQSNSSPPEWDAWHPRRTRSPRQRSREEVMGDWFEEDAILEIEARQPRAKPIRKVMETVLKELQEQQKLSLRQVLEKWPDIVGPEFARVSTPQRIDRKTLYVEVCDAAWLYQMRLKLRSLLQQVRALAGDEVTNIRLVPGGRTASR